MVLLGQIKLSPNYNHLQSYDEESDSFLLVNDRTNISHQLIKSKSNGELFDVSSEDVLVNPFHPIISHWILSSSRKVVVTEVGLQEFRSSRPADAKKKIVLPTPVLGCFYLLSGHIVSVTQDKLTIHNFSSGRRSYITPIDPINKCTAITAEFSPGSSEVENIAVLVSDGKSTKCYRNGKVLVISGLPALAFSLTQFGFLVSFEGKMQLGTADRELFTGGPVNLDSMVLPRTSLDTSGLGQLKIVSYKLDILAETHLPGLITPCHLAFCQGSQLAAVSGFNTCSVSIYRVEKDKLLKHCEISLDPGFRCGGIAFRDGNLLALKWKYKDDPVAAAFPSATKPKEREVHLEERVIEPYFEYEEMTRSYSAPEHYYSSLDTIRGRAVVPATNIGVIIPPEEHQLIDLKLPGSIGGLVKPAIEEITSSPRSFCAGQEQTCSSLHQKLDKIIGLLERNNDLLERQTKVFERLGGK